MISAVYDNHAVHICWPALEQLDIGDFMNESFRGREWFWELTVSNFPKVKRLTYHVDLNEYQLLSYFQLLITEDGEY